MSTFFDDTESAVAWIRWEAGIASNTNITDANVTKYQLSAYGEMYGVLAKVYDVSELSNDSTDFKNSPAQDVLTQIEWLLAAWQILKREIGMQTMNRSDIEDGNNKIQEARNMLRMIKDWTMWLYLSNWGEFTANSSNSVVSQNPTWSTSTRTNTFTADDVY